MKKRVFIALPISDAFKKEIDDWKEKLKVKNPDVYRKIRWMPPENLHITLIPPFYRDEDELKKAIEVLDTIQGKIGGFELNFEKISFGPTARHPRLVWVSGKSHKMAESLKSLLEEFLKLPHDKGSFSPHITIGRFKERDFRFFSVKSLDEPFLYVEEFKEFLLIESKTLPEGAEYSILGRFTI